MEPDRDNRRRRRRRALLLWVVLGGGVRPASACDICAVYTATLQRETRTGPMVGMAEQFTHFGTLKEDGVEVPNPGEHMNSSITQLVVGYGLTHRFSVQMALPIIARVYRRLEEGSLVHGNETGFGDLSLVGNFLVHSMVTERSVFRFSVLGGLKLPSGNPDRLSEELAEDHDHGATQASGLGAAATPYPLHASGGQGAGEPTTGADTHAHESGIHGHDLALGSGSVDGIIGGQLFWSWDRLFVHVDGQYAIRRTGAFDYRYANDLIWAVAPGVLALAEHEYTLGLQAIFSGETKGKDELDGATLDDTALTALYLGPGLSFTWSDQLAAELSAELPVRQHNTALQILPDFRVRGGITWRF